MRWDEHRAIEAVDRAIAEIKHAAIDDGKPLEDHPPVDAHEQRRGRLHRAVEALHAARKDISGEEDNGYAGGLRAKALHHVEEAVHLAEEGEAAALAIQ